MNFTPNGKMTKLFISLLLVPMIAFFAIITPLSALKTYAADKPVVIVIDPGHGGTGDRNLGAQYNGISEKEINLQLANAVKAELEKFDNVSVFLTRTTDTLVSLEDRAVFAQNHGADFVFSIHFNASNGHEFYGSEVWTSTFDSFYQNGYAVGQIVSLEWSLLGLYQKGVKTKIGSSGQDYYGIIKHCVARNIPCVIFEHGYLDNDRDVSLIKSENFINRLAIADATAIAKFFKLKSSSTGTDYSGYIYSSVKKPSNKLYQDETGPAICDASVLATDPATGNILVELTTVDKQSPVIYFSYSYDGGATFCPLQMWDRTKDTQSFNITVPSGTVDPVIVVRSYNNYEKMAQSDPVAVSGSFAY